MRSQGLDVPLELTGPARPEPEPEASDEDEEDEEEGAMEEGGESEDEDVDDPIENPEKCYLSELNIFHSRSLLIASFQV